MKTYLVGGAVRDKLLDRVSSDFDYVVVGATRDEMLDLGFSQVGAEFPVFLHPETGDEYALARKEKSTGPGYHDFVNEFGPDVTLAEDLYRRDLTINAMAMDDDENVHDPWMGQTDVDNQVLRHVSEAFADDPVRVLRLARFHAQLGPDWKVADATVDLCQKMAKRGMLAHLTNERVSKELMKALGSDNPRLFFDTLAKCGALEATFPVLFKMRSVKEDVKWHPEGNTYEHTMLVLTAARGMNATLRQMYCALTHDFGKTLTDPSLYPRHLMHEVRGVRLTNEFSDDMRVPSDFKKNAALTTKYHMHMHKLDEMRAKTYVKMFDGLGVWNNAGVVGDLFLVGKADARGKLGSENKDVGYLMKFVDAYHFASSVKFMEVVEEKGLNVATLKGERCKQLMKDARTKAVALVLK